METIDLRIKNQAALLAAGLDSYDGLILSYYAATHTEHWFVLIPERVLTDVPVFDMQPKSMMDRYRKYKRSGIFEISQDPELIRLFVSAKRPQEVKNGVPCQWCGGTTLNLNSHHFPIPKSKGGADVVNICPACHYDFHFVMDRGLVRFKNYTDFY